MIETAEVTRLKKTMEIRKLANMSIRTPVWDKLYQSSGGAK